MAYCSPRDGPGAGASLAFPASDLPAFHPFQCTAQHRGNPWAALTRFCFLEHFTLVNVQMFERLFEYLSEIPWMKLIDPLQAEILGLVEEAWQQVDTHQNKNPRADYRPLFTPVLLQEDTLTGWTAHRHCWHASCNELSAARGAYSKLHHLLPRYNGRP